MKDNVFFFGFSFYDEETDTESFINKGFIIKECDFSVDEDEDAWLETVDKFESPYGVHDWCTAPDDRVHAIGFYSGEVEEDKADELMEGWRQHFINEGCDVTEVVDYNEDENDNDYDIYQKVLGELK